MEFKAEETMETFFESFPHIAENIFRDLDKKTLKNCFKVSVPWRSFLTKQRFVTNWTHVHPGWDTVLTGENFEDIALLLESLDNMEEEKDCHGHCLYEEIHPIFSSIYSGNLDLVKRMTSLYPDFQNLLIKP